MVKLQGPSMQLRITWSLLKDDVIKDTVLHLGPTLHGHY